MARTEVFPLLERSCRGFSPNRLVPASPAGIIGFSAISSENATSINVSKLEKGTYVVQVKTKNGVESSRFIKN
ncbi:T9SS type A sorting domain-containing protein [Epilithonimonas sp. FP105]|nr:T9SS type A sorting domain-containing protein [Epilithonimonas sp. FP105]